MLRTTDNNCGKSFGKNCIVEEQDLANFQRMAEITLNNKQDNTELLIFSHHKEELNSKSIFTLAKDSDTTVLTTNNIMGFVGLNGSELTIKSRFAQGDNDYFLHYMLQKVFSINLFDLEHSTAEESIFDFLLYLFPFYLNKALRQGLYKQYKRKNYNNAHVKGSVNVARHIKHNMPFTGNIAYSTREHSYDNDVTQLIRHTIEVIKKHRFAHNILSSNTEINSYVRHIIQATPSFEHRQKIATINANLRPLVHPYFTEYPALQKLCLQILRYEGLKYGHQTDKIYGLLFDGAWLWEEYLHTILKDCGFTHPRNDSRTDPIYLFEGNKYTRYPDFYKQGIIVDAKYKRLESKSIDRNDMNQIISYMYVQQASIGGFLYPLADNETSAELVDNLENEIGVLNGYDGIVKTWHLPIPTEPSNFKQFCQLMQKNEQKLATILN